MKDKKAVDIRSSLPTDGDNLGKIEGGRRRDDRG